MKSNFFKKNVSIVLYILLAITIIFYLWNIIGFRQPVKVESNDIKTRISNEEKFKQTEAISDYKKTVAELNSYPIAYNAAENCKLPTGGKILNLIDKAKDYQYWLHNYKTCELYNAFMSNKIKIIKPTLQTNNLNDKKLQPYWEKCSYLKERLNTFVFHDIQQICRTGNLCDTYTIKRKDAFAIPENNFYGNFNYKLYDIDIDNNSKNGKQRLFYSGGFYTLNKKNTWVKFYFKDQAAPFDQYGIFNLPTCEIFDLLELPKQFDFYTLKPTGSYTGVFEYKNKYLIYSYKKYNDSYIELEFDQWTQLGPKSNETDGTYYRIGFVDNNNDDE
ncbi:MAG: hypothetical protein AB7V50_03495 [Vampirovibrionia bacterium]